MSEPALLPAALATTGAEATSQNSDSLAGAQAVPKVSIIVPVYNTAQYFRPCLDSAIGQTLQDIEIIVIDDASTDGSLQIIREYAQIDTRIKVIAFTANQGNGYGRNEGLRQAKGEYILFLDSDDWLEPDTAEAAFEKAKNNSHDVVLYGHMAHYIGTKTARKKKFLPLLDDGDPEFFRHLLQLRKDLCCMPWQYLVARSLLRDKAILFSEGIYFEDFFFTIKTAYHTQNIGVLKRPLYHYRQRTGSITASASKKKIADMFTALSLIKTFLQSEGVYRRYQREYLICFLAHGVCYNFLDYWKLSKQERDAELDEYMRNLRTGKLVCQESVSLFSVALAGLDKEEKRTKSVYTMCRKMLGYLVNDYYLFSINYRLAFWIRRTIQRLREWPRQAQWLKVRPFLPLRP